VTAEAAISILRARGLSDQIQIASPMPSFAASSAAGFWRPPTDFPVLQGRLAIDQAIRVLEGKLMVPHAGPAIRMMTPESVNVIGPDESLNPAWFLPTFTVE
jgi:protein TorT